MFSVAESDDVDESEVLEAGDDFPVVIPTPSDIGRVSDLRSVVVGVPRLVRWLVAGCWKSILLWVTVLLEGVRERGGITPTLGVPGVLVSPLGVGLSL
jgi:hypothetical protein